MYIAESNAYSKQEASLKAKKTPKKNIFGVFCLYTLRDSNPRPTD